MLFQKNTKEKNFFLMEMYPRVNTYCCHNLNTFFIGKKTIFFMKEIIIWNICEILKENSKKNSELWVREKYVNFNRKLIKII